MAVTRADTLTGTKKQREFFSDFVTSFSKTPLGDQLGRVTNEQSVKRSIRNLLLTDPGERFFRPNLVRMYYPPIKHAQNALKCEIMICIKNEIFKQLHTCFPLLFSHQSDH